MAPQSGQEDIAKRNSEYNCQMNQLLPYEESFVKKMEQLPVPDFRNAIWEKVHAELATDAKDISNSEDVSQIKINNITNKLFIGVVILVTVTAGVILMTSKRSISQKEKASPEVIKPEDSKSVHSDVIDKKDSTDKNMNTRSNETFNLPQSSKNDSTTQFPAIAEPQIFKADSLGIVIPGKTFSDSSRHLPVVVPNKKSIGVPGISDSNYRITGKRDSLNKFVF